MPNRLATHSSETGAPAASARRAAIYEGSLALASSPLRGLAARLRLPAGLP
ncbi:hypothetical protein [Cupriavidus sp. UYPR2.512]|uniref:hypothetical protein n=1 Tax=Cupriavidus sp. UYPR2.512 TaxID=1080187 RepID=UPI0012FC18A8|nr:hypothetical protein [Cupriavidus sp. UYPR2.512]UIF91876.1 hypothetical protein KAF44_43080 [Cupriavidus necator]